jgi:hypothetical protein
MPKPKESKEGGVEDPEVPMQQGRKRPILVQKIDSGLRLYKNPSVEDFPDSIRLKLGYDVPRGNPISSYQELDFDVSKKPIEIESRGVYFMRKEKNELEFKIEDDSDFEIKLTGFDAKRDLFLKIQ